jgi:hypothetical protein
MRCREALLFVAYCLMPISEVLQRDPPCTLLRASLVLVPSLFNGGIGNGAIGEDPECEAGQGEADRLKIGNRGSFCILRGPNDRDLWWVMPDRIGCAIVSE